MASDRLIAIVGPTASGKTALAIRIAEQLNGEIICADSRTIYKGMDIGTAKPTTEEQSKVPHWGLDSAHPGQPFMSADFKKYADAKIADIQARGKLPLLVGGTGLYVDSLLYDFTFGEKADNSVRDRLETMSIEELTKYCITNNVTLPENKKNKRYLVRAIERKSMSNIGKSVLRTQYHIVGIATNIHTLRTRIVQRTEQLFANGVEQEATLLGKKYGWNSEAMTGNIYPLLKKHFDNELSIDDVKEKFVTADYKLAKRQMTWFRRNPDIMWATLQDAESYIKSLLATE